MKLRTLGGLSVEGVTFRREKVLLLLAYLCIEGPQARRRLAELFWPDAANPMNSLAQHLVHLRTLPGALIEDGVRVASTITCDACTLRAAIREGRHGDAVREYHGAYLDALTIPLGPDLEEWVYDTRDALAREARSALITLAGQAAAHGHAAQAADLAARALLLDGAPPADDLDLPKLWHLLSLTGHPLAAQVEREARDLGLTLHAAPTPPGAPFVGRQAQLDALTHLPPGHVAWVSGHAGMGKSALLDALARTGGWTALSTRTGVPYSPLDPLLRVPPDSPAAALNALRDPHLRLTVDAWDTVDDATRHVIEAAARHRPGAAIVITARLHPPFEVDLHLQLDVLSADDLRDHPGLHALTEGHPTLVAAALRGQPLDVRQGARVRALPPSIRDTYLLLALQGTPNLRATRKATGLSADGFALTLSHLTQEGLTAEGGHVYAAAAARDLLEQVPVHAKLLHLKLARVLPGPDAWPHYDAARDLWEEPDEDAAARAAAVHASDLMKRGLPGHAVTVLDAFRERADLAVPHAWALLGVGRHRDALRRLEALPGGHDDPAVRAASATALVYMGRHEEAEPLALSVTGMDALAAHAATVLAHAARIRERWDEVVRHSRRAADLWQLDGNRAQHLLALGMVALARTRQGELPDTAFADVLGRTAELPSVHAAVLSNYASALLFQDPTADAEAPLSEAARAFELAGDRSGSATALGNLAVQRHLRGDVTEAAKLYRETLNLLSGSGNLRQIGQALCNLSEIEGDLSAFEDTIELLLVAGQQQLVEHIRGNARVTRPPQPSALRS